jgi:Aldo/keto reductase family
VLRFDSPAQLTAMVKARDKGLIGGIGLSNITREHLLRALAITDIACVQNPMNLADRHSLPVLNECEAASWLAECPEATEHQGEPPSPGSGDFADQSLAPVARITRIR